MCGVVHIMTYASYPLEAVSLIGGRLSLFNRWVKLVFSKIFITNVIPVVVMTDGLACILNTSAKNIGQWKESTQDERLLIADVYWKNFTQNINFVHAQGANE